MKCSPVAAIAANAFILFSTWNVAQAAPLPPPEIEVAVGLFPEGRIALTDYICPRDKIGDGEWSVAVINKPDGTRQAGCYTDTGNNHLLIKWFVNKTPQPPVAYDFMRFEITSHGVELFKGKK